MTPEMREKLERQTEQAVMSEVPAGAVNAVGTEYGHENLLVLAQCWINYHRCRDQYDDIHKAYPRVCGLMKILDADADDNTTLIEILKL
jgi:hypothetical protein